MIQVGEKSLTAESQLPTKIWYNIKMLSSALTGESIRHYSFVGEKKFYLNFINKKSVEWLDSEGKEEKSVQVQYAKVVLRKIAKHVTLSEVREVTFREVRGLTSNGTECVLYLLTYKTNKNQSYSVVEIPPNSLRVEDIMKSQLSKKYGRVVVH